MANEQLLNGYNLGSLIEMLWEQMGKAPSNSPLARDIATRFINRAVLALAEDAPFLFQKDSLRLRTDALVSPGDDTDTLQVAEGDQWVLRTSLEVGDALAAKWNTDRRWDCRTLLLKNPADTTQWLRYTIREIWEDSDPAVGPGSTFVYISLTRPWSNDSDTGIDWRVVTEEYPLPVTLQTLMSVQVFEDSNQYPLSPISQPAAESYALNAASLLAATGTPGGYFRRQQRSLANPKTAPGVALDAETAFNGGEVAGKRQYLYTYVWGRHDSFSHRWAPVEQGILTSNEAAYTPWLESPPSPLSGIVDTSGGSAVLTLPNFDRLIGFDDAGTARYRKSGVKKRIYVRVNDESEHFYPLTEVDGYVTSWTDTGTALPDRHLPLSPRNVYETIAFYPVPSDSYELQLRCLVRPDALLDESDAPPVPEAHVNVLLFKMLEYAWHQEGNVAASQYNRQLYDEALRQLKDRHGSIHPPDRPLLLGFPQLGRLTSPNRRQRLMPVIT